MRFAHTAVATVAAAVLAAAAAPGIAAAAPGSGLTPASTADARSAVNAVYAGTGTRPKQLSCYSVQYAAVKTVVVVEYDPNLTPTQIRRCAVSDGFGSKIVTKADGRWTVAVNSGSYPDPCPSVRRALSNYPAAVFRVLKKNGYCTY